MRVYDPAGELLPTGNELDVIARDRAAHQIEAQRVIEEQSARLAEAEHAAREQSARRIEAERRVVDLEAQLTRLREQGPASE